MRCTTRGALAGVRMLTTAIAVATLSSCGGGGGGAPEPVVAGTGLAPTDGPGDTTQLFPALIGDTWSYDVVASGIGVAATHSVGTTTVIGTGTIAGVAARVFELRDSSVAGRMQTWVNVRPGGISRLGNDDAGDDITPRIVPYVELAFPVSLGPVSTVTARNLAYGSDSLGNPVVLDLTQTIVNVAWETVLVPGGEFTNALRQTTTLDATVRDDALGLSVPVQGVETRWLTPGVGIVKQTTTTTAEGQSVTVTGALRGWQVAGHRRGLGEPHVAVDGLSPAGSSDPAVPAGEPAIATDGSNFLVVARRAGGGGFPYTTQWTATLVTLDGTVLASADLGSAQVHPEAAETRRAAVAWDGSGWLVVYEVDNDFATTGLRGSLVAQRVSAAGAAVGTAQVVAGPGASQPTLASDGTRWLLSFVRHVDASGLDRVAGVFVSPTTGTADGAEFPITPADGYPSTPSLAFGGGRFLVAWSQRPWMAQPAGVLAARVDPAGAVLDTPALMLKTTTACCLEHRPHAIWDGSAFAVAWSDYRRQQDNLHTNIHLGRVSPAGALLDGPSQDAGRAITTAADLIEHGVRAAAFDGETLLTWSSGVAVGVPTDLRGARVTSAGRVVASEPSGTPLWRDVSLRWPALAATPAGALLVWSQPAPGNAVAALPMRPFGR